MGGEERCSWACMGPFGILGASIDAPTDGLASRRGWKEGYIDAPSLGLQVFKRIERSRRS